MVAYRIARVMLGVGMAALAVSPALAATLTYRGDNKWVAPADNKPLRALMKDARNGKTHFTVRMPATQRTLATSRLMIVRNLLEREAGGPIVIEETDGSAKANTLVLE